MPAAACAACCRCQNTKLRPLLDGAPNFRQVEGLPVYGVAIPTVRGLRNVLDELGAANGESARVFVCWARGRCVWMRGVASVKASSSSSSSTCAQRVLSA
jgi:hypothetical protein